MADKSKEEEEEHRQPNAGQEAEPPIEPDRFDAIVVSTGLPEVLIASALAAAGKSVLLLDSQDYYGGAWASVGGQAFSRLLFGAGRRAASASASASASSAPLPFHAAPPLRASGVTTWDEEEEEDEPEGGERGATQGQAEPKPTPPRQQRPQRLPPLLSRCRALDLAPRALYQGELLVDGLVALRAHPYVEFKLVEGSYVLDAGDGVGGGGGGKDRAAAPPPLPASGLSHPPLPPPPPASSSLLLRIPASKAHIFADRGLLPREKRSLMRFLAAGLEAAAAAEEEKGGGSGSGIGGGAGAFPAAAAAAKEASSLAAAMARRDVPLARVLRREGLPRRVRDFVLYGIAMACAPEEDETGDEAEKEGEEGAEGAAAAAAASSEETKQQQPHLLGARLSAAEGRDALALYASSLGRFASPSPPADPPPRGAAFSVAPPPPPPSSAFMAAAHGAGSLVEAFVRHAAVNGALTVLRRPVEALLLSSTAEEGAGRKSVSGVRLAATGQALSARAVIGGRAALAGAPGVSGTGGASDGVVRLARCVAVLDGPLRPSGGGAAADSSALLVAPPAAATEGGSLAAAVVVRGLLLGPAAQAGPPPPSAAAAAAGRGGGGPFFLLYLVADVSHLGSSLSAEAVLAPVLTRLAARGRKEAAEGRPRVLEAVFYSQSEARADAASAGAAAAAAAAPSPSPLPSLPEGLVVCPGPEEAAPGVAGYVKAWSAAEALFRRHFPATPWIGETAAAALAEEGSDDGDEDEEEAGSAAASARRRRRRRPRRDGQAGVAEEEKEEGAPDRAPSDPPTEGLDAIDELSSALAALGEDV